MLITCVFQNLTTKINQTRSSLGISEDRLNLLSETVKNLTTSETTYRATVQQLVTKVSVIILDDVW